MHPRPIHLLFVAVLACLWLPIAGATPPADAFCVITIEGVEGFQLVRVIVDEETSLADREQLWPAVDGDSDGRVTPEEKDDWRRANLRQWSEGRNLGNRSAFLTAGDSAQRPLFAVTWREIGHTFHQREYELPSTITEAADLETQEVREFRFQPGDAKRVVLHGGTDHVPGINGFTSTPPATHPTVVIEYVVLRAPPGWMVESVRGFSYDGEVALERVNEEVLDLPAFDTKRPFTVTFVRVEGAQEASASGMGVLGALAFALVCLAVGRKKVRKA